MYYASVKKNRKVVDSLYTSRKDTALQFLLDALLIAGATPKQSVTLAMEAFRTGKALYDAHEYGLKNIAKKESFFRSDSFGKKPKN